MPNGPNVPHVTHLSPEALARLATEPPAAAEAAHLAGCAACAEELAAMRAQLAAVAALPRVAVPDLLWPTLARTLRAEGLMRDASTGAAPTLGATARSGRWRRPTGRAVQGAAARAAAACLLCVAGGVVGAQWERLSAARGASRAAVLPLPTPPTAAGRAPQVAVPMDSAAVIARLAALEMLVVTSDEAVRAAPDDPVLRHYRADVRAARNALLQHVALTVSGTWY